MPERDRIRHLNIDLGCGVSTVISPSESTLSLRQFSSLPPLSFLSFAFIHHVVAPAFPALLSLVLRLLGPWLHPPRRPPRRQPSRQDAPAPCQGQVPPHRICFWPRAPDTPRAERRGRCLSPQGAAWRRHDVRVPRRRRRREAAEGGTRLSIPEGGRDRRERLGG